jgi:ribonuclease HI
MESPPNMTSPSLATALTFEIVFDGGSLGNPGKGYGSYEITSEGAVVRHVRHEYGNNITNNQAEYQTLIEALKWLQAELGATAKTTRVEIFGDSLLVINQLQGKWKVKNAGLRPLVTEALDLISRFGTIKLNWHARSNSVDRLGH